MHAYIHTDCDVYVQVFACLYIYVYLYLHIPYRSTSTPHSDLGGFGDKLPRPSKQQ